MSNSILFIDLETQNHPYYGSKSSPKHPNNYVVAVGTAVDDLPVQGRYFECQEEADVSDWLDIPDDVWLIVAHNAPFEIQWFLHKQRKKFMDFLKRGGRVFCTAYAEYLLSNQQTLYPDLNSTAPKYGGTHKVDGVKLLWEQGRLTSEIDKMLLYDEYLLGEGGDVDNTRKTFYGQFLELSERGMWDMALLRMEGMLCYSFCMDAGLFVNSDIANAQKEGQEQALKDIMEDVKVLRGDVPDYVEFNEDSRYHMSAWLYGGPIKYRVKDVWYEDDGVTPKYEKEDCVEFEDGYCVAWNYATDMLSELQLEHGEAVRFKAGKNKGSIKPVKMDTPIEKLKWYDRVVDLPGIVKLTGLPTDFKDTWVREYKGKQTLANGEPVYSSSEDALKALCNHQTTSPEVKGVLEGLLKYAKINKDLGTYYLKEEFDDAGEVVKRSGMLQYLTEHGVVYHQLNMTSTATGRLSSSNPNMQNLPRGDTSEVKKMFTSRYDSLDWLNWAYDKQYITKEVWVECCDTLRSGGKAGAIVEADYSNLEVVTLAAFSKDKNLVAALLEGTDMHCLRLSQQLGEDYTEVLKKCKDETHPEHAKYKTMRTEIKPKAFAYQYGAQAYMLSLQSGCSLEEAQTFIDTEKALFSGVEEWYEEGVFAVVEASKTLHREQGETGAWRLYGRGVWTSPAGTCYEFREMPKTIWTNGKAYDTMQFKPTQMRNYPIQGESGFFVQGISGQVIRWLISKRFFDGRVSIINQVHDALYFDCCRSVLQEVCSAIKRIMEGVPELFEEYGYDLVVPFPVEVEAGESMFNKEHVTC